MVHSQHKGRAYEQKINRIINQCFGFDGDEKMVRTPLSGGLGFSREDATSVAHNFFRDMFFLEYKNREAGNVYNWYNVSADKKPIGNTKIPIVVHTKNQEKDFVTLHLDDFLYIVSFVTKIK